MSGTELVYRGGALEREKGDPWKKEGGPGEKKEGGLEVQEWPLERRFQCRGQNGRLRPQLIRASSMFLEGAWNFCTSLYTNMCTLALIFA